MFGPMEDALRGRRFLSDEVIGAVQNLLETQPKNFFFVTELKKLAYRWNRCVEVEGDYIEK
jgi:hypothetical protein